MKVFEGKVHKGAFLVGDIGAKVFANNNIPSVIKFKIKFPLDNGSYFGILLGLKDIGHISNFFNGSIGYTNDGALVFRLQIRHLD